jgi:phosphoribosylglycinamide formyltransferase-1
MVGGDRLKVAILISGRGSNMRALAQACADSEFPAEVACVISNRADAAGLKFAATAGLATQVVDHKAFPDRDAFDAALSQAIEDCGAELVCLAGFMRLLGAGFVNHWRDRLINIHPSLLPAFKGLETHERVLASGTRFTGCTVHFVRPEMDDGPIIVQAAVPVLADDTDSTLADRVLAQEHGIYPLALRWIAEGRVRVVEETVVIDGVHGVNTVVINPKPSG